MAKFKEFLISEANLLQALLEGTGLVFSDYVDVVPSQKNIEFYKLRQEGGKTGSFLKEVVWDEDNNGLLLRYEVTPTYENKVKIVNKQGKQSSGSKYIIEVLFEDVDDYLGNKKEFLTMKKKDQIAKFRQMMRKATIRIWSNDASHWWQGSFEQADKYGYAIYKFPGPKGKGIWARRHIGRTSGIYGTKHLIEVMKTIPFLATKIINMLNK